MRINLWIITYKYCGQWTQTSVDLFSIDLKFVYEQKGNILCMYCDSEFFKTIYLLSEMHVHVYKAWHIADNLGRWQLTIQLTSQQSESRAIWSFEKDSVYCIIAIQQSLFIRVTYFLAVFWRSGINWASYIHFSYKLILPYTHNRYLCRL
jgi:hypothetical protein